MLRGIAALLVVVWHSRLSINHAVHNYWIEGDQVYRAAHYPAFLNHLDVGVDIFFCISGFIMNLLIYRLLPGFRPASTFLANRAIRIFPPYWFFTLLVVIAFLVSRGKYNLASLTGDLVTDGNRLLVSLFLAPQDPTPILGVGWTLIYECQFYVLCALAIMLGLNRRLTSVLGFASLVAFCLSFTNVALLHGYVMSTFNTEFLLGALVFQFRQKVTPFFPILQIALALVCYLVVSRVLDANVSPPYASLTRPIGLGLAAALLISGLVGADYKGNIANSVVGRALMRIGDASYTLYLSHWFVLSAMGKLIGFFPAIPVVVVMAWHLMSIALAIFVALLFAEHVELPIHRYFQCAFNRFREDPLVAG